MREMVDQYGIPLSLYRDRHGSFQRNDRHWTVDEQLAARQTPTHLGRELEELGIQQIAALSPQAKGVSSESGGYCRIARSANCD